MTRYYIERAAILLRGGVVEAGVSPYSGYEGEDLDGELTFSWQGRVE